jgi:hypothetical protein
LNEKTVWDYFYNKLKNPYGVAALMGNLYVESKLNPQDLQGSYERSFGMTNEEYTKAVDNGSYQSFVRDGAGYGLAQWTFWSRKEGLYNYAKERGVSIGDLNMQLDYIWKEIQLYKTAFNAIRNATSVRAASDVICEKYEKATNQSEKGKQTRADYGQKFLEMFKKNESNSASKQVVVLNNRTNIRTGNGTNFPRITQVNKNAIYEWVATADNGWHAIKLQDRVAWISGEFSKLKK